MCLAPRGPSDPASGCCPGGPPPPPPSLSYFRPFPVPGDPSPLLAGDGPIPSLLGFPVWPRDEVCGLYSVLARPALARHSHLMALGLHPSLGVPP